MSTQRRRRFEALGVGPVPDPSLFTQLARTLRQTPGLPLEALARCVHDTGGRPPVDVSPRDAVLGTDGSSVVSNISESAFYGVRVDWWDAESPFVAGAVGRGAGTSTRHPAPSIGINAPHPRETPPGNPRHHGPPIRLRTRPHPVPEIRPPHLGRFSLE
ncbi:hypothetical protein E4U41_001729 [Claviceps citrina]|nr:hypothetical protein E4U41_001729 [Claviceps citrina]